MCGGGVLGGYLNVCFIHSLNQSSFKKYSLSTFYMQGIVPGGWDIVN